VRAAQLLQALYKSKMSIFRENHRLKRKANFFEYRPQIDRRHPRMQVTQKSASRAAHRSTSPELAATIQPAKEAAGRLRRRVGRFEIYDLLEAIYRVYTDWKRLKTAKRSARTLADEQSIVRRKGMSPIRVLIEATLPKAELKQKSRWVRALEYVHSENVSPSRFRKFVRRHGGLAGCARLAVSANRKRRRPRRDCPEGDWSD
jgi:hypothetical protein